MLEFYLCLANWHHFSCRFYLHEYFTGILDGSMTRSILTCFGGWIFDSLGGNETKTHITGKTMENPEGSNTCSCTEVQISVTGSRNLVFIDVQFMGFWCLILRHTPVVQKKLWILTRSAWLNIGPGVRQSFHSWCGFLRWFPFAKLESTEDYEI